MKIAIEAPIRVRVKRTLLGIRALLSSRNSQRAKAMIKIPPKVNSKIIRQFFGLSTEVMGEAMRKTYRPSVLVTAVGKGEEKASDDTENHRRPDIVKSSQFL